MKAMQSFKSWSSVQKWSAGRHSDLSLTSQGSQSLRDHPHLPAESAPAALQSSVLALAGKGLEEEPPARLTAGKVTETSRPQRWAPCCDKLAEAGPASPTEGQFRSGFDRGCGQPPPSRWRRLLCVEEICRQRREERERKREEREGKEGRE